MDDYRISWDIVNKLFEIYKITNMYEYLEQGKKEYSFLAVQELALLWQGFDRAAEEWQPLNKQMQGGE